MTGRAPRPAAGRDDASTDFDAFVTGSGRRLLRTAYLLTGDHGTAQDLVQDALVQAWGRWPRVSRADEPQASVRRMMAAESVSRWQAVPPGAREDEVWPLLATLPRRQRAVLVLSCYEDLSDAQVAEELSCSTGTVTSRRTDALRRVGARIADEADPERTIRDELVTRADEAGVLTAGGPALRETARRVRAARLRAGAAAVAVAAALTAGTTALTWPLPNGERPSVGRPPSAARAVGLTQPYQGWLTVALTGDMARRALRAAGVDSSASPVVATRLPGSQRVAVLLASEQEPGGPLSLVTATLGSDEPGATAVAGTAGRYPSYSSLIAQPLRDGDATVLLVLLPPRVGDTVEVTSSEPGEPLRRTSAFVTDRLALVPVTSPESVTRIRVLREGRAVVDTVPAATLLGPEVPRTLERVVATSGGPPSQPVQVRTDGRTACRLTVGGWWEGPASVPWNPFDPACATVDGRLHLLLADDRRHSSVAGLAPAGASHVRLHWRSGEDTDVTDVPVTRGDVASFIDTSGHRPDNLVRAEARNSQGDVLEVATP